jgi:hypothetical protein
MRRDNLSVDVHLGGGSEGDSPPTLHVTVDRSTDGPADDLLRPGTEPLDADDVDVALRRGDDDAGVLSIARRLTGEYLLEANVESEAIEALVAAAGDATGEKRYRVVIDEDPPDRSSDHNFEKRTLLVYDAAGNLERENSLIPSGVEL